jgi:hypothetical protein
MCSHCKKLISLNNKPAALQPKIHPGGHQQALIITDSVLHKQLLRQPHLPFQLRQQPPLMIAALAADRTQQSILCSALHK